MSLFGSCERACVRLVSEYSCVGLRLGLDWMIDGLWLGRDGTSTGRRMGGWALLEAVKNGLI